MSDDTIPVREGEDIDIDALAGFLHRELGIEAGTLRVEQFPSGASNLTYLVSAGRDAYVLRRPPFGNTVKTAHDMRREYFVLSKLSAVYPPAPRPLLFCDDSSIIGVEFYLMERRGGLILRGQVPRKLLESPAHQHAVCEGFIKNLADLHSIDRDEVGLSELGSPDGYVGRQVEGWTKRYFAAKTHELGNVESAIEWLNQNIPVSGSSAIIHNDYKFDNVMLDRNDLSKITAVLDWEMATVGDPLMDLGTTLGYWISDDMGPELMRMPFNPRLLMENISRQQLVDMYSAATGRDVPNVLFYYVFGTFKIAVIAQQIFARYIKGFTKDTRFAGFDKFVEALGGIAARALDRGSI